MKLSLAPESTRAGHSHVSLVSFIYISGEAAETGFARTLGRGKDDFVVGLWEVLGKARK